MIVSTQVQSFITPEQYLEIERRAAGKSEYWQGVMYAMAGASREHNLLVGDLFGGLRDQLRGQPRGTRCEAYSSDMRVFVPSTGLYTYPDVVVACGEPRFLDDRKDTLLNPGFLAEILSPSTEAYDRGRKFEHYRSVESLQEYLLVAQDRIHVELYRRQPDGAWLLQEASRSDETVEARSIACRLVLGEIYERLEFPAAKQPG